MRIPQKPPAWRSLAGQIPETRRTAAYAKRREWMAQDRYLHWNELRRRPAPEGFSHEEYWYVLKLFRSGGYRHLALNDKSGNPFVFAQPNNLTELLHQLDRGLGMTIGLPEALEQSAANRDRYVVNMLMEEAITSSQLEGAATTRPIAREMLRTGRPPRDKSERMILNNFLTMRRIRDLRAEKLTPEIVFELHRLVTDGTLEKPDAAGRLRRADEAIRVEDIEGNIFHEPPVAGELPARLEAMCRFANGDEPDYFVHPVLRAIILHFWLAYDHPLVDGNGRTARALFYWSMLRHDYQLFEFISISEILLRAPARYAEAFLHTETDDNDLTYFILHQAGVIREAVKSLRDYLARKKAEYKGASASLRGMQDLNHRQQALLIHALREPGTDYLIAAHQRSHGVTHQTARTDLFALVELGLLVVRRSGRTYRFRAPADLAEKLGKHTSAPAPDTSTLPLDLSPRTRDL
ncbi:MAG: Fic family protein [Opitutae bacterium]|nr:Fic family protein [Opitutae bacterium]